MRKILKQFIPAPLWRKLGILRRRWICRNDHKLGAREVFNRIYEMGLWDGAAPDGISSGTGSRDRHVVDPYVNSIIAWATNNHGATKTAFDMGCGDFSM